MGSADIVPGVSGGTVALVLGIQENAASNRYVRALGRLKGFLGSLAEQ